MAFMAAPVVGTLTGWNLASIAGTIMQVAGGMNQADQMRESARANAENARRAAEAEKVQLDYQAGQETAAGQHAAEAARRKSALMLSRAQAIAAASGGGPLNENLAAGLIAEGEKEAGHQFYTAGERAKSLTYRGDVGLTTAINKGQQGIYEADRAADATIMGSLAKGAMGMASLAPGPAPGLTSFGDRGVSAAIDGDFWRY